MHKRAFQALKRTFLHISGLPPPLFIRQKTIYQVIVFFLKSKYGDGRPDAWTLMQRLKWTFMHVSSLFLVFFGFFIKILWMKI